VCVCGWVCGRRVREGGEGGVGKSDGTETGIKKKLDEGGGRE